MYNTYIVCKFPTIASASKRHTDRELPNQPKSIYPNKRRMSLHEPVRTTLICLTSIEAEPKYKTYNVWNPPKVNLTVYSRMLNWTTLGLWHAGHG